MFIKKYYNRLMEHIQEMYSQSKDPEILQKYAKYIKKVRQANGNDIKASHNFVLKHLSYLFDKKCEDIAISCLMQINDIPPLYSKEILEIVREKGSAELCRKYLEYLTFK